MPAPSTAPASRSSRRMYFRVRMAREATAVTPESRPALKLSKSLNRLSLRLEI